MNEEDFWKNVDVETEKLYGPPKNMTGSDENPFNDRLLGGNNVRFHFEHNGGRVSFSAPEDYTSEQLEKIKQTIVNTINNMTDTFDSLSEEQKLQFYLMNAVTIFRKLMKLCQINLNDDEWMTLVKNDEFMKLKSEVFCAAEMFLLGIPSEYKWVGDEKVNIETINDYMKWIKR